jgi:hypothetical protein
LRAHLLDPEELALLVDLEEDIFAVGRHDQIDHPHHQPELVHQGVEPALDALRQVEGSHLHIELPGPPVDRILIEDPGGDAGPPEHADPKLEGLGDEALEDARRPDERLRVVEIGLGDRSGDRVIDRPVGPLPVEGVEGLVDDRVAALGRDELLRFRTIVGHQGERDGKPDRNRRGELPQLEVRRSAVAERVGPQGSAGKQLERSQMVGGELVSRRDPVALAEGRGEDRPGPAAHPDRIDRRGRYLATESGEAIIHRRAVEAHRTGRDPGRRGIPPDRVDAISFERPGQRRDVDVHRIAHDQNGHVAHPPRRGPRHRGNGGGVLERD